MRREVLYIRVSTSDQEKGDSIPAQESLLREASKNDKTGEIIKVFKDSESGKVDAEDIFTNPVEEGMMGIASWSDRKEFKEMMMWAKEKKFDVLRIKRLDRLGRSVIQIELAYNYLKKQGIEIRSVQDNLAVVNDSSFRIFSILMAQRESESNKQRTSDTAKYRTEEKGMLPNRWFFGYDPIRSENEKGKDGKMKVIGYKINEQQAEVIRKVFDSKIKGEKPSEIIGKTINKIVLTKSRYHDILKRQEYIGLIIYDGKKIPAQHLKIIDLETWEKAQKK